MGRQPSYDDLRSRCDTLEAKVESQGSEIDALRERVAHLESIADTNGDTVRTLASIVARLGSFLCSSFGNQPELADKLEAYAQHLGREVDEDAEEGNS